MRQLGALLLGILALSPSARAEDQDGADSPAAVQQAFQQARQLSSQGDHYESAATYFNIYTAEGSNYQQVGLGHVAEELILAGFPNAASYFYIQTLKTGNRGAIRRILAYLPRMMEAVGGDLLRPYIVRHTTEADYDPSTRAHFFYFLGKDELLKGNPQVALDALSKVGSAGGLAAQAAYLRGAAFAMTSSTQNAISSFESCQSRASSSRMKKSEAADLEARCTASLARAYYQNNQFEKAEDAWDEIPKSSFVWTDILFEQAWNAYAKGDYNRTLGKLVAYRSPSLGFVFNPEVDVLRAQSFLKLCYFDDVDKVVQQFEQEYAGVGSQMKRFILGHEQDLGAFYAIAREAMHAKLHTTNQLYRALNRFVRGPYFAAQLSQERATRNESARLGRLAGAHSHARFASFLTNVVGWRAKTVHLLGGLFVKNSLADLYNDLVGDLDKMSFIKLEMLNRYKHRLEKKPLMSEDEDGVMKKGAADIDRRDYQYFWTFNGEFWLDELGDYVFALESQCGGS